MSTMTELSRFEISIKSDVDELLQLDALLTELLPRFGVQSENVGGLIVAIVEAVSNAIIHGNRQDPQKLVHLQLERLQSPSLLRVTVEDMGEGFDPTTIPDPTQEAFLLRESGRGIFLMRSFAKEVHFHKGGRCVELIFSLE